MQAGGVLSLSASLRYAISRRRGILSFRGRGHSPSPAVRMPSAGYVASPPFRGRGHSPSVSPFCNLPLISGDMCLRTVSAVSSSPDLISLLVSQSAFCHPYVLLSSLATYSRYFRCNTVPAAPPNTGKASEGRRSVLKRRNGLTERSGRMPSHAEAPASGKKMCVWTHRLRPDAPGARDALDAPWQRTYRFQRKTHRQSEFGRSSPRHHAPRRSSPWHLLTGRSVAGHFCSGRTVSGHFPSGRTVSGHFPSGRSRVRVFSFWT